MKALLRPLVVGGLSIAIAGVTLLGTGTVALALAKPVIQSLSIATPVNEGDKPIVSLVFTDADPGDPHTVQIAWGDGSMDFYSSVPTDVVNQLQKSVGYADNPAAPGTTYTVTVQLADVTFTVIRTLTVTVLNVPPSFTSFTLSSTNVDAGANVTATGVFTDPGVADTHTVTVDWGDTTAPWTANLAVRVGTFTTAAHAYAGSGTFTVTATVTDDDTGSVTTTSTITVNAVNQAPSVTDFSVTPGNEGAASALSLTFADPDAADTHNVTVAWGDGVTDAAVTLPAGVFTFGASHVYTDTGTYTVGLTLTDSFGHSVTTGASVSPTNVAPTLGSLTLTPASVVDHQAFALNGSFTDPGVNDTFTLTIEWGDGQTWTGPLGSNERSFSVSHSYTNPGPVSIRVSVADRDNGTATSTLNLVVEPSNHAPTDLVLTPSPAAEGGTETLAVTFNDLDAIDTHSVVVSWGDGTSDTVTLAALVTSANPTHTYADSGTYNVSVSVSDGQAQIAGTSAVVVANVAPTVGTLSVSPASPVDHDVVTVSAAFTDPGKNDTFNVSVDWGDRSAPATQALAAGTRNLSASHPYLSAGSFTVTVTVTDRDGGVGSQTATVVVGARNTAPSNLVLTWTATDLTANVRGTFDDSDTADRHTVAVDWGDGTSGSWLLAAGARSYSFSHTYAAAGTFTVSVSVTDQGGLSVSGSTSVTVTAPPTTVGALLDQLEDLVKSFGLDRNTERWLLKKLEDIRASFTSGSQVSCDDLRLVAHLESFAGRTLNADQVAALKALTSQISTAAGCGNTQNVKPATQTASPKAGPSSKGDKSGREGRRSK